MGSGYWGALKYVGSVMQVMAAVSGYVGHRDESLLAEQLTEALLDVTGSAGVPKADVVKKVGELIQMFEGKLF